MIKGRSSGASDKSTRLCPATTGYSWVPRCLRELETPWGTKRQLIDCKITSSVPDIVPGGYRDLPHLPRLDYEIPEIFASWGSCSSVKDIMILEGSIWVHFTDLGQGILKPIFESMVKSLQSFQRRPPYIHWGKVTKTPFNKHIPSIWSYPRPDQKKMEKHPYPISIPASWLNSGRPTSPQPASLYFIIFHHEYKIYFPASIPQSFPFWPTYRELLSPCPSLIIILQVAQSKSKPSKPHFSQNSMMFAAKRRVLASLAAISLKISQVRSPWFQTCGVNRWGWNPWGDEIEEEFQWDFILWEFYGFWWIL